jgi:hypothetical protein
MEKAVTANIRDSPAYVRTTLAKVQHKSEFLYTRSPINTGPIKESSAEIHSPTQCKVIGRNTATSIARIVAQQFFSASLFSLGFNSRRENLGARYKNVMAFFLLYMKTGSARRM